MGNQKWYYYEIGPEPQDVDDDAEGEEGKSDEEKIDNAVKKVVEGLPGLTHLQLGDYKSPGIGADDLKWGKSVCWLEFVKGRGSNLEAGVAAVRLESEGENDTVAQCRGRGKVQGGNDKGRGRGGARSSRRGRRGTLLRLCKMSGMLVVTRGHGSPAWRGIGYLRVNIS